MANPYRTTLALPAAVANGISLSQSLASAGNLTITGSLASGGVATLTSTNCAARRVGITSAGNDSAMTWTITGTDRYGNAQSESFAGANTATASSVKDYAKITKIAGSAATASTVTAGTTSTGSTEWRAVDFFRETFNVGLGVFLTGSVTYSVEGTLDDPNAALPGDLEPGSAQPPLATALSGWSALTASNLNSNGIPIVAVRLTITANTGTAVFQVLQTGIGS